MRVAFFGTPAFAVPTLAALLARHEVIGVVTQPDKPSGRGQRVAAPPVKEVARTAGVDISQPTRLKDEAWLEAFRRWNPEIAIVVAYGRLLPQALLDIPPRGFLNVHASLLPRYRGAAPIQRAVMNGEPDTGVTIMRVVLALDAGPMLAARARPIGPEEGSDTVERDLAHIGAALLLEVLDAVEAGTAVETPQDDALASYAPRLAKEEGPIDWHEPAQVLHNRVRGLRPWPLASSHVAGHRLAILRSRVGPSRETATPPGAVVAAQAGQLVVATGASGTLEVLEVQPEGRRAMTAREFLAGHRLAPGTLFGGPPR